MSRDPLDRHYTPDALALRCVLMLSDSMPEPEVVWEPHVGGGAFVRAVRSVWPSAHIIGSDIDPDAEGLLLCDEAHVGDALDLDVRADLVLGNPPFSGTTAIAHVTHAKRAAPVVGFILPWSLLGGVQRWAEHMDADPPVWSQPIVPRPWPDHVRETAWTMWTRDLHVTATRVSWLRW